MEYAVGVAVGISDIVLGWFFDCWCAGFIPAFYFLRHKVRYDLQKVLDFV